MKDPSFGRLALMTSIAALFARGLGIVRNSALAAAIGTSTVADAYNITNSFPNMLFFMLGGGTIAAVFVPILVHHSAESEDRFREFATILILVGGAGGALISALLVACRSPLIYALGGSQWSVAQRELGEQLAVWCLPQLFFFIAVMMLTQVLNAKGLFAAASWTPALNNLVIIFNCVAITYIGGVNATDPGTVSDNHVLLLGAGTLGGSVLQCLALYWGCRRAGVRFRRPRGLRGYGLRGAASTGSMTLAVALASQVCNMGVAILCTRAGAAAAAQGAEGRGYSTFLYAQAIVLAVQLILTGGAAMILLQRLSKLYADDHDHPSARRTIGDVLLRAVALLVPATGLMIVTAPWTVGVLFAHGEVGSQETRVLVLVFAIMSLGLLPYGLQPILVRPFYAQGDARTPMRGYFFTYSTYLTISVVGYMATASRGFLFIAASAFVFAYWIDLPLKIRRLRVAGLFVLDGQTRAWMRWSALSTGAAGGAAWVAGSGVGVGVDLGGGSDFGADIASLIVALAFFVVVHEMVARQRPISLRASIRWLRGAPAAEA